MPLLSKPLYQRNDGGDEDRWRLMLDTDTQRFFVAHEQTRGDIRGSGYCTSTDEMDITAFLTEHSHGQRELMRLLEGLFEVGGEARQTGP